jgi:putative oxidoreductase
MKNKKLNIGLWIAQSYLALFMIGLGVFKLITPIAVLSLKFPWTGMVPKALLVAICFIDISGGLGIFFPSLLRIKPHLTPYAAIGIILLMSSAIIMHILLGEFILVPLNLIIIAIAGFVYWGRSKRAVVFSKTIG